MNRWIELFIGLILVSLSIYTWGASYQWTEFWNFGNAAWTLLKGGILWAILFAGILFIILGISDLKN